MDCGRHTQRLFSRRIRDVAMLSRSMDAFCFSSTICTMMTDKVHGHQTGIIPGSRFLQTTTATSATYSDQAL